MRKIAAVLIALGVVLSGCGRPQGHVIIREEKPDLISGKMWTYLTIRLKDGTDKVETYTDVEYEEAKDCQVGDPWPSCLNEVTK